MGLAPTQSQIIIMIVSGQEVTIIVYLDWSLAIFEK